METKEINIDDKSWDIVVKPKGGFIDINLRELWNYNDLTMLFVKRDFIAQYKQTILGPLWHFVQPLLTTLMFIIIFGKIAKMPTSDIPDILFYLSGITIWNYFSVCFNSTSNSLAGNAGIFGKVYFPRLVLPISTVISNIVRLSIQLLLLLAFIIFYDIKGIYHFHFSKSLLYLPIIILLMAFMSLSLGLIISSLTTKYRDLVVLVTFGLQLLMYVTPVAYTLSYANSSKYGRLIKWNPLSPLVEGFRHSIFNTTDFNNITLLYSFIYVVIFTVLGLYMFSKEEKRFMDTV